MANTASDPPADLGDKLTRLADGVLDELLDANAATGKPSLDQRLDALKTIGTLHLGLLKQNGKKVPEEDGQSGLPAARRRLMAIAGGGEE